MKNLWTRGFDIALVISLVASLLPGDVVTVQAAGAISLTTFGTPYTQNFDTLASFDISSTIPNGWFLQEVGSNANTTYRANNGSSNQGDTYSYGPDTSTDRAFGGLRSSSLIPTVGAQFINDTGGTITSLAISYTGEQWRLGNINEGRLPDRLDFEFSFDATSPTTGIWLSLDTLDFSSKVTTGTVGPLNGNSIANSTDLTYTLLGLSIPKGSTFWIRWNDWDISSSDDGLAVDDFSLTPDGELVTETAPSVTSTVPEDGAIDFYATSNLSVTFSEPVDVVDPWFSISCDESGEHTAVVSGGPVTFTLDPDTNFTSGESCTLTVLASGVDDQDEDDPPYTMESDFSIPFTPVDACTLPYTHTYEIQGSAEAAAITGAVTTQGVVVGDYEGASPALRGFFLQDISGDGDETTSDGIFVYNGSNNSVSLGDVVRVSGTASDYQGQTQVSATSIYPCGTGNVDPLDVTFPVPSVDYLERYEGMLVRLPQTMYVTEHYQLGRFGQVTLSSTDRLYQPTGQALPGDPALAIQASNDLNRIILDDASQVQNPDPILFGRGGEPLSASNTLRGGDTATGIVGVLNYTWGGNSASPNAYRIRPVNALGGGVPDFQPENPRPATTASMNGRLVVTSMNLLNYFNTFDGCTLGVEGAATDCRGAEDEDEFDRQWPKTVAAIIGSGADVIGIMEIENDGYGMESALADLVSKLNDATAPGTYAFIDADADTATVNALGTDAIKVGLIYKPAAVTPSGTAAVLNTGAFGDFQVFDEVTVELVTTGRNRPALAQSFEEVSTGEVFTIVVNHLKSKGSSCENNVSPVESDPDIGDGQGNCNLTRLAAAEELASWLATDPTGSGDPDILIVGDLNSYTMEDPVRALESAGFTNLILSNLGPWAYSYVFDGQWGYLDHALASSTLAAQVVDVVDWHINADEPIVLDYNTNFKSDDQIISLYADDEFRMADHDPVLIALDLCHPYIEINKSVTPTEDVHLGETVTYTITIENPTPVPAGGVTITDTLPTEVTFGEFTEIGGFAVYDVETSTVRWSGFLGEYDEVTISFTVTLNYDETLYDSTVTNRAEYAYGEESGFAEVSFTVASGPQLQIAKTVSETSGVELDGTVVYTVTLTNDGEHPAVGVLITDTFPAELSFTDWVEAPTGVEENEGELTWSGEVGAGEEVLFSFEAGVNPEAVEYGDVIENSVDYVSENAGLGGTSVSFALAGAPLLEVEKTVSKENDVAFGSSLTYTIRFANSGESTAEGVLLSDTLPEGVTFSAWTAQNGAVYNEGEVTWAGNLASGAEKTISFTVEVTHDFDFGSQTIKNQVDVSASNAVADWAEASFTMAPVYKLFMPLITR